MGIDYNGGMIVGAYGDEITVPENFEDLNSWLLDKYDMTRMASFYDADNSNSFFGFPIDDILINDLNEEWINKIKKLGKKFEDITLIKATLVGIQDIF